MNLKIKKPNILFALADDASHFGVYGHRFVDTPNIDSLARSGVVFNNAFTTNPKCAPSRASILTGMHTWQLENAANHYSIFPAKFRVFPDILEENGYLAGFTGKGWAPGDFIKGGFKRNPAGKEYNECRLTPPENSAISNIDYAENFNRFLEDREEGQSFFFWYGCFEPHRVYTNGEGIAHGKNLESVDYIPSYLPSDDIVKSDLLDYAFEIDWFDLQLGKMLKKLEEIGELDNTFVVVTSDNGMPFPRVKGQMYEQDFHLPMVAYLKDKCVGGISLDDIVSFIDIAPTFLELAGAENHPQIEGRSFLYLLSAKESGIADKSRNAAYFGREKHDLGRENDYGYPVRCVRTDRYLYVRNYKPERWPSGNPETGFTNCDSSPTKSLVLELYEKGETEYFDLCFGKRPYEELYDIAADSECLYNLAETEPDIKNELSAMLDKKLIETNDPRMLGNGDIFESYEYVGGDSHSWKAYKEGRFINQKF